MAYFFYNILIIILFPFIILGLIIKNPRKFEIGFIKSIPYRIFKVPAELQSVGSAGVFWLHCSSLGEAKICHALAVRLGELIPSGNFVISVVTKTAYDWLNARKDGNFKFAVFYAPFDIYFTVRKYMETLNPKMLVIVETEIWPNLVRYARSKGALVCLVNARISDKNFKIMEKFKFFLRYVLKNFSFFLARTRADSQRLIAMGAESDSVVVTGNMKYDIEETASVGERRDDILKYFGIENSRRVVAAGSIRDREFQLVVDAYMEVKREFGDAVLIFAPRHLSSIPKLERLFKERSADYTLASELEAIRCSGRHPGGIIVADMYGLLPKAYYISSVCVVGGGFEDYGGQNIIEPAVMGKPVICGKYMSNFQDVYDLLESRNAVVTAEGVSGLSSALKDVFSRPDRYEDMGRAAREAVLSQKGALERNAEILSKGMLQ